MKIYCTNCKDEVNARLTDGSEMYPHRKDLYSLPFWVCKCGAFVGCHHKTSSRTKPLGYLASQEIKDARKKIHAILDPMWRSGKISRSKAYSVISEKIGKTFHSAEIKTLEEARQVYSIVLSLQ